MQSKKVKSKQQVTPRQLQLLKAIADFEASRCYLPTIGELASELGVSRSTAFEHIAELRRKGMLSARPGKARSLRLASRAQELLKRVHALGSKSLSNPPTGIPFMGKVAAGLPIEAVENKEHLSLTSCFGGDDIFALEVKGDSMIGEDIREGDYAICRHSCVANNGQLVVAVVDDEEATLKRFYKENGRVRLQPANDDYAPIYSDACRIEAIVVGLVRRL